MGVKGVDPDFTSWSELLATLMCACNPIASVQNQLAVRAALRAAAKKGGGKVDSSADSDSESDVYPTFKDVPLPPSAQTASISCGGVLAGRTWNLLLPYEDVRYVLDQSFILSLVKMTHFSSEVSFDIFSWVVVMMLLKPLTWITCLSLLLRKLDSFLEHLANVCALELAQPSALESVLKTTEHCRRSFKVR
jgi:hypothetical protein